MSILRIAVVFSIFFPVGACATEEIEGRRFPGESDYLDDWATYRESLPTPFFVEADFDGDGRTDEAWILISTDETEWGLFVIMVPENGEREVIELGRNSMEDQGPQSMGISLTPPGKYKTACGKGYYECEGDETEYLNLKFAGIDYFRFESANSIFHWDAREKKFKRTWISD